MMTIILLLEVLEVKLGFLSLHVVRLKLRSRTLISTKYEKESKKTF